MGDDFNPAYFYTAATFLTVMVVAVTVAGSLLSRRPAAASGPGPVVSVGALAGVVATLVVAAVCFIGLFGAILDDELNDRPGNRHRAVAACWYLCAAGTDPTGRMTPAGYAPTIPVPGWIAWFTISGAVAGGIYARGVRWYF